MRRAAAGLVTTLLVTVGIVVLAAPAGAASLSGSRTAGLDPAGETIGVSGSGYVPGIQVYVALCNPAVGSGGACDMVNFRQVPVDGAGNFSTALRVVPQFGATDCTVVGCAVQTSRVGMGADRSQEATLAVGFAAAPAPVVPAPPAGGTDPSAGGAGAGGTGGAGAGGAAAGGAGVGGAGTVPDTNAPETTVAPTTAAPSTTTTRPRSTSTTQRADDERDVALAVSEPSGGDGGGSALPWILGGVIVVAIGASAAVVLRRRASGAPGAP